MVLRDKNETTTKPPAAMNLQTVRLTEAHRIVNILQAVLLISLLFRLAPSNITTSKDYELTGPNQLLYSEGL